MKYLWALSLSLFVTNLSESAFAQGSLSSLFGKNEQGGLFGGGDGMGSLSIWHWIIIAGVIAVLIKLATSDAAPKERNVARPNPYRSSPSEQVAAAPEDTTEPSFPREPAHQAIKEEAAQPFSDSVPVKGMALRLKRGERSGALGKIIFTLDARIDVSADNRALIEKYKLGNRVIYDSANREAYAEAARRHLDRSRDNTSVFAPAASQAVGIGKTFYRLGRAAVSATISALSLRITVNSLMKGVHVECKDMDELLEAEGAIVAAGQNLKEEIAAATTFTGQEQIIEL